MYELEMYQTEDEDCPFESWLLELDREARLKITTHMRRLEQGNFSNVDPCGSGVSEKKIDWGPGYRIYFGKSGDKLIVLLAGGTKRRQSRDIAAAKTRWEDYKKRRRQ